MVLLSKEGGDYRVIGLVGVIWNICFSIINNRLHYSISRHDYLHNFIQGRGVATSNLESNLDQYLAGLFHETLFPVFLDVRKSYDLLYRGRCMEILRRYGLGTNL